MRLFFSFFILFNVFQAQNLKVEYTQIEKQKFGSSNTKISSNDFKNKVAKELEKGQKNILFVLDGDSFFKSVPIANIVLEEEAKRVDDNTITQNRYENVIIQTKIYSKKGDKGLYQYHNFDNDEFYHYSILKFDQIEYKDDVEYIENYKCKLVEASSMGSVFRIWYTEDVPISAGPYAFNQFPGLVLKVESSTFLIFATKVSNEGKKEDFESINPKLKVLNDDEFMNRRSDYQIEKSKVKEKRESINL